VSGVDELVNAFVARRQRLGKRSLRISESDLRRGRGVSLAQTKRQQISTQTQVCAGARFCAVHCWDPGAADRSSDEVTAFVLLLFICFRAYDWVVQELHTAQEAVTSGNR